MGKRTRRRRTTKHSPAAASTRGTLRLGLVLGVLVVVNLYVFLFRDKTSIPEVMDKARVATEPAPPPELPEEPEVLEPEEVGRWVTGEVQGGDSLGQILRREGLTPPEADALIRALREHMDLRKIRAGQKYRIHFDDAGTLLAFEFEVTQLQTVRASRAADGTIQASLLQAKTEIRVIEVGGTIESSLWHAIKDSGESTSLVGFFVDVFAYDINFYIETQQGDEFRMLIEKEYLDGAFYRYGRVLAAEYSGDVGTFRAFWWKEPGAKEGRYFDENGRSVEKTFLKSPLKYARVSSKFNPKRMHPILHRTKGHWGVDYAAPTGTPVWAAASGRITYRGPRGGAGNCVIINHDNGMQTIYMHLSKFHKGQAVGQRVRQKDVIGYVGATGLATGPHLHFGVKVGGRYVDPAKLKMQPGPPVAKKHRELFAADTGELVSRLAEIAVAGEPPPTPAEATLVGLPN